MLATSAGSLAKGSLSASMASAEAMLAAYKSTISLDNQKSSANDTASKQKPEVEEVTTKCKEM